MDRCNRTGLPFLAKAERGSLVGSQRADRGDIERASVTEIVSSPEGTAKLRSANQGLWPWTGAPCSPQRTWAENGFFKCFHSMHQDACPWPQSIRRDSKSVGRGWAPLFRP